MVLGTVCLFREKIALLSMYCDMYCNTHRCGTSWVPLATYLLVPSHRPPPRRRPLPFPAPADGCYPTMIELTRAAMAAAGPHGRLRGILFIEGEGTALLMNNQPNYIAPFWSRDFTGFVNGLRSDLAEFNPHLPVIMAVQRVADRDRWVR